MLGFGGTAAWSDRAKEKSFNILFPSYMQQKNMRHNIQNTSLLHFSYTAEASGKPAQLNVQEWRGELLY